MKTSARVRTGLRDQASSWIAAVIAWVLLSALAIFIIFTFRDRAALIRDNTNERLISTLFTNIWNYDDFGAIIESSDLLKSNIKGFAIYGRDLLPTYEWGKVPEKFDETLIGGQHERPGLGRFTIPDPKNGSVKFIVRSGGELRAAPSMAGPVQPSPQGPSLPAFRQPQGGAGGGEGRPSVPAEGDEGDRLENFMRQGNDRRVYFTGEYFYVDISQPAYWRTMTITSVLLPLCVVIIAALILAVRNLYIRNREYRERIESQKNLVVLGTAASTLAHEIKNPLSSIRLQTGILTKLYSEKGSEEVAIINEEVDRLSELTYRVNDYLRESKGNPSAVNISNLAAETGSRLSGRNIVTKDSVKETPVFIDPERLRSVLENLIRNALESESPVEDVGISIERSEETITLTVFDRGRGIDEGDMGRIFDPFFTRKSAGTGIGLSISKRFTEAAGGTISIKNREGGGTEAIVSLPMHKGENLA